MSLVMTGDCRMPAPDAAGIAVPEAAAAAGLLAGLAIAPIGIAAAAGLVALMVGALAFRIRAHNAIPFLLADVMLLVLAAVTATLRSLTG